MAERHEQAKDADCLQHVHHVVRQASLGFELGGARGDRGLQLLNVDEQALGGARLAQVEVSAVRHLLGPDTGGSLEHPLRYTVVHRVPPADATPCAISASRMTQGFQPSGIWLRLKRKCAMGEACPSPVRRSCSSMAFPGQARARPQALSATVFRTPGSSARPRRTIPCCPCSPTRWAQRSPTFTKAIPGSRLPPRRWASWKPSWRVPMAMCCMCLKAIPYRARFACSSSSTRPKRRSWKSGPICRIDWLACNLDWSTSRRAIPWKPSGVLRNGADPPGKATW